MSGMSDSTANNSAISGRYLRMFVALVAGVLLVPILLFVAAATLVPLDVIAYGNTAFWIVVLAGSLMAAVLTFRVNLPSILRSALLGFVVVFCFLIVWLAWLFVTGAA